ncbi:MAG: BRO family protein [Rikenellaceae bacterium]
MNKIEVFRNPEFGEIEIAVVDGNPHFKAIDVCRCLGYSRPHSALKRHVHEDDSLFRGVTDALGRERQTIFINESGLYSLVMRSKLKEAQAFQRWVTSEVLPAIRKTGQYITEAKTKELEAQNQRLLAEAAENAHKVNFFDNVQEINRKAKRQKTYTITKVGSRLKANPQYLNKLLINNKVIIRVENGFDVHPDYADANIAYPKLLALKPKHEESDEYDSYEEKATHQQYLTYTEAGVELINNLLMQNPPPKKK